MKKMRTCKSCGWVHMGISKIECEDAVERFNKYFYTLSKKERKDYYGDKPAIISSYDKCFNCGGSYENFRDYEEGDCPDGVTIQPIMVV